MTITIADLLGVTSLVLVAFVTLITATRLPYLAKLLLIAFCVRMLASVFNVYIAPLPDSISDAISFERHAWEWAEGGLSNALQQFTGPDSYFISWVLALAYAATDRSLLMAQSVSMLFGMGTVLLGALLAKELWGQRASIKAGWVLACFPTLILYSALVLREAYIWFFVLVAFYGVVLWAKRGNVRYIFLALAGFVGAAFFHGAMIVGAVFFMFYLGSNALKKLLFSLSRVRVHLFSLLLVGGVVVALFGYVASGISLPKIGSFQQAMSDERIIGIVESRTRGSGGEEGAVYPEWTQPSSAAELFIKAPVRMAYFLFSPFPWDVRNPAHLIGLFDGMLYILLVFLLWRNRRAIWANPAARAMLFITLGYVLVFSFGVGNFGTGLRHRAKFVAGLIILAAPLLPMLRVNRQVLQLSPPPALHQKQG